MKENVTKKRQEFRFSPGECYFRSCALRICDNAKDCTSRSFMHFFFSSSILKSCFLWQCHRCEFGHHKESFVYVSTCQSEVRLSCCEVPSTQSQDNFVSDVSFHIIVTLAWFWLCKMWLFPCFVKYVIEIHVAKVALGVLHLNFLQIAPGQSTSFKLVDHSPTHNTSTQRVRSYILISLNAHWRIS